MNQGGIVLAVTAAVLAAGSASAGVQVLYGMAELAAFGTPPAQSSVSLNWPGSLGPVTVRVPPAGTSNVTRVDLTDFTDDGVSLTASGAGRWSTLVGFRFSVDAPTTATLTGRLFGDSGSGLLSIVLLEDMDSGVTLFLADAAGATFASGTITLQPGTEYGLTYQSNYGVSGGTGQGSLMNLVLTIVPEPQAIALACTAGVVLSRRRRG